jgi:hypothetical protein
MNTYIKVIFCTSGVLLFGAGNHRPYPKPTRARK